MRLETGERPVATLLQSVNMRTTWRSAPTVTGQLGLSVSSGLFPLLVITELTAPSLRE